MLYKSNDIFEICSIIDFPHNPHYNIMKIVQNFII